MRMCLDLCIPLPFRNNATIGLDGDWWIKWTNEHKGHPSSPLTEAFAALMTDANDIVKQDGWRRLRMELYLCTLWRVYVRACVHVFMCLCLQPYRHRILNSVQDNWPSRVKMGSKGRLRCALSHWLIPSRRRWMQGPHQGPPPSRHRAEHYNTVHWLVRSNRQQ